MKSIYYLTLLILIFPWNAFAQDMVRIPGDGNQAIGYVPCAVTATDCSAATLEKKTIDAFEIDSVPVTNGNYKKCVADKKCAESQYAKEAKDIDSESENKPVVVTFDEAQKYCEAVGKKLPTPEQWLAAAFIHGVHAYSWGDEYIQTATTVQTINKFDSLEDVASFPKDQVQGIYDLSGNGYEWIDYPEMGEAPSSHGGSDAACIILRSRMCLGAAPHPLYRMIGIWSTEGATFRCVK